MGDDDDVARRAFETQRLNVFAMNVQPTADNEPRLVCVAFLKEDDQPTVVLSATLWPAVIHVFGGVWVDWIETASGHRRQGLAREFWEGAQLWLGEKLVADDATPEGKAFLEAIGGAA